MLPAPTTIATSTPMSVARRTWRATAVTRSGSIPYSPSPISASPESFRTTRRYTEAGCPASVAPSAWCGLLPTELESHEPADGDVLAHLGRQTGAQLLDRRRLLVAGSAQQTLIQERDLFQALGDTALDRALTRLLRDVL